LAQGSTRYNIGKQALLAIEFQLPSFAEQTAIAEVLTDLQLELEALETKRSKAEMIKQGMTSDLLSGKVRLT
jgi:type I restriction enzyme S subunit